MALPFKYTSSFSESIAVAKIKQDELNSFASLDPLKNVMPKDIDLEKNIDLVGVAFNAAVANKFNKNGDGIDSKTAIAIKDYFIHKPTNIEHNKKNIVGHVVGASLSEFGSNKIINEDEAKDIGGPFNIALSAVIYKSINREFATLVEDSMNEDSANYQVVSASWEIGFNDYAIAVGGKDLSECTIIAGEERGNYDEFLKCYGGNGRTDSGEEVNRLIIGEIYPIGIGFTANPAAEVKGLTLVTEEEEVVSEQESTLDAFERIEINNNIFEEKTSHSEKDDVILCKNQKPEQIMEKEILSQLTETLEAQASEKKLTQEAIANITKVFHDAIIEKSDQWESDKVALEAQKEELVKASEESSKLIEDLKAEVASVSQELEKIKTEVSAREDSDRFNDRMSEIDDMFDLEDEDRIVLASELKELASEGFEDYKEKLSIVWKHKTKAFKEEQEKIYQEKLEEEVQKRLAELSEKGTEVEASSEEVTEEAIENVEAEEDSVSNNDASSAEEELSLKEKFKEAFSKENVTIQL